MCRAAGARTVSAQASTARGGAWVERRVAAASVLFGLLVAAAMTPVRHGIQTFALNFGWRIFPAAGLLGAARLLKARGAIVTGAALAWTAYVVAFSRYAASLPPRTKLWIWYPLPAAGAVVAMVAARRGSTGWRLSGARAGMLAAGAIGAGLALSWWITWRIFVAP